MDYKPRPRLKDFSYVGRYTYFLTFCTKHRAAVFTRGDLVLQVLTQFLQIAAATQMKQIAYIFMPDHVHLMVRGMTDASDLCDYAKRVKQKAGFEYRQRTGKRLWQPSFYDHVLRGDEGEASIIRYMVLNPVAAGLVRDPADYPFWGTADWSREEILRDLREHPHDVWEPPDSRQRRQD